MEKKFVIKDSLGLHLRPASELCTLAMDFECKITLRFREKEYNVKSLLSVLSACVQSGDEIVLEFDGPDAQEAYERISEFLEGESNL